MLLAALCLSCNALAKQSDTSLMGTVLTPMGSIMAANADGSIPAWTGGLAKDAAPVTEEGRYTSPFADEAPLFVVNANNLEEYRDLMTEGQIAMLQRYPTYQLNVFPTHRSINIPADVVEQTKKNLTDTQMTSDGYGVENYHYGIPFPQPTVGLEVIWNHLTRYRGGSLNRVFSSATVKPNGEPMIVTYEAINAFRESVSDLPPGDSLLNFSRITTLAPARMAGEITLVHDSLNQVEEPRAAWQYNPGQRRVRRAPVVAYDSSARYSYGQVVSDSVDGFNGAPDRYNWELIGKQELLVGYNAYNLIDRNLKYTDIINPGHLATQHSRFEKHRVWVVEATLKEGARHVYAKRRFYIDEDSWKIMASDIYDSRGQLWRQYESHLVFLHDIQVPVTAIEVTYDLISGQYATNYMINEAPRKAIYGASYPRSEFTPAKLKRLGK